MSAEKQIDPRIGKHGAYQPQVCAVTGQHVNGNHNSAINLSDGYYFRVLNKAKRQSDIEAVRKELSRLIGNKSRTKVSEVKAGDK